MIRDRLVIFDDSAPPPAGRFGIIFFLPVLFSVQVGLSVIAFISFSSMAGVIWRLSDWRGL